MASTGDIPSSCNALILDDWMSAVLTQIQCVRLVNDGDFNHCRSCV